MAPPDQVPSDGQDPASPEAILSPEARAEAAEARALRAEEALRELQHRAKNSLQLVISLLRLQHHRIVDPEARAAYDQTMHRVEVLAVLYRQMHESRADNTVDLARYFREVTENALANAPDVRADLKVSVEVESLGTALYTAMPLGLVVNELVTAGARHAYPEEAWMAVRLESLPSGQARLTVEDNGRGLPQGFDPEQDASTMLVEALATQLGADLDISRDAGTRVQFTMSL